MPSALKDSVIRFFLLILLSFLKIRKSMPLLMPLFEALRVSAINGQHILLDVGADGRSTAYL